MDYLKFIPENLQQYFDDTIKRYEINTDLRVAHFLAQLLHESQNFKCVSENLNYSSTGLINIFHKYFPNTESAINYAKRPAMIASKVYANRYGNGDENSQDGWKYHGRGYIQLTFKDNYQSYSTHSGLDCVNNPDLLLLPQNAMDSAGWFFSILKNLNPIADKGNSVEVVTAITKAINGGVNGLQQRIENFNNIIYS